MKKIILILIMLLIFVTSCTKTPIGPSIKLETESYNLGTINPDDGIITKEFSVKNVGSQDLEIISVSTSCGCTEADIEDTVIKPGQNSILTVVYDPLVHPGLVGELERVVYVQSNDPVNREVELVLTAYQQASKEGVAKTVEQGDGV
ncbi:DUF1573 domain-containing protein [Candidatus Woesearchaeota archaeon]|nr:DUF1573 domain-containing protein [Candidatus Woesearchaeota archaeon]